MTSLYRIQFYTALEFLKQGYLDEAVAEFKKAIKLNPNLTHAYNNLALTFINKREFDEAILLLNKSKDLVPREATTQNLFGLIYYLRENFDLSILHYKRSIDFQPNDPTPYKFLIEIYTNIKKDIISAKLYTEKLKLIQ
tara:strand:- start:216 stop:632 length:417 start_codon:yes stop_codon:yes gene_type:complete